MGRFSQIVKRFLTDPVIRFGYLKKLGVYNLMSDKAFIRHSFKIRMNRPLDLENPKTYNEKIQWLKLYNRKPEYTTMVDKVAVKEYVAERIGWEYIIPTLGVWDKFRDIDFDALPDRFVLKCSHDSGGIVICQDKRKLDLQTAKQKLERSLSSSYYLRTREWPYKNVVPRILAEEYMEDEEQGELRDYKFFCFHGVPKMLFIATDRQIPGEETKFDFFDMEFRHLDIRNGHPNAEKIPEKPVNFEKMKELAARLSENIPHLRVDFYEVNGKIYFGELTFSHWSGMVPFDPPEWDRIMGDWITIPKQ